MRAGLLILALAGCVGDIVGRDAIRGGFESGIVGYDLLVQVTTNGLIDVDGDRATGRWNQLEMAQLQDGSGSQLVALCHDDYLRGPDGWRLRSRPP